VIPDPAVRTGRAAGPDPADPDRGPDGDPVGDPAGLTATGRAPHATGPAGARRLWWAMVVVGVLAAAAAGLGAGVPSTYGGSAAVDEPQYLLTALSLYEDRDLDIADELADRRYLAFHDADLPVQTSVRPDGSQLSPHDPLLPLLLAVPMGLGGWLAAKLTLAALAGVLAALLLWVAVRRFAVPVPLAAAGTALAAATAPLAVYGQQVYPELPAALAVLTAVAAVTTSRQTAPTLGTAAAAITALPWLSVKYVPVAAVLALLALARARTPRRRAALLAVLAVAGAAYLGAHRLIWGGWTVYASGDHFETTGEFSVVGTQPDYAGRTTRLLGLLVDRDFGLAAWQPAWLLLVPALAALLATRPRNWPVLALPLAAGWATATWVALTMHGYWWPGRQLVAVLPLGVLAILAWLAATPRARVPAAVLAVAGVAYYAALLTAGTPWVLAPDRLSLHPPAGLLLPDDRDLTGPDRARYALWVGVTALIALRTARRAGRAPAASRR
jgi:hypothetical protein